jgi:tripartite-type tricarboxylate transporter receptor subunit TctC
MLLGLAMLAAPAAAQQFPSKTVRIVVPFAPGGGSDILARALAQKLAATWKQSVVVDNLPGAGGAIGADAVAKSAADGHTLLVADASILTTTPYLYQNLPYAATDLAPVINLATFGFIIVAPAGSAIQSLADVIAMDRAKSSLLNVASSGNGTSNHLALEKFNQTTGLRLAHVPYKGAGQAINDVVGAQVDLMFTSGPLAAPLLKAGRLKALSVTSPRRMALTPDVPTVTETGVARFEAFGAQGVFAPAGTPQPTIDKVNADIATALKLPDIRERWAQMGLDPIDNSPAQFAEWVAAESKEMQALIRNAGIKPN